MKSNLRPKLTDAIGREITYGITMLRYEIKSEADGWFQCVGIEVDLVASTLVAAPLACALGTGLNCLLLWVTFAIVFAADLVKCLLVRCHSAGGASSAQREARSRVPWGALVHKQLHQARVAGVACDALALTQFLKSSTAQALIKPSVPPSANT